MVARFVETIVWLGIGYAAATALILFFEQRNIL